MSLKLRIAAFAGIFYLVSILPELVFETMYKYGESNQTVTAVLAFTYVISMLSTIVFFYGFMQLGMEYHNNVLVFSSVIIIIITFFYYLYAWYTRDLPDMDPDIFGGAVLFLFGFSGIFFGYGLYSMHEILGKYARIAGIFEMLIGICFVTIILFLLGLVLAIPTIILEILLLFNLSQSDRFKRPSAEVLIEDKRET